MRYYDLQELFYLASDLDYEKGMKYFLGNLMNYRRGMLSCIKSIQHKLPMFYDMIDTEDYTGLRAIMSNFCTLMTNIGATRIADISEELCSLEINDNLSEVREKLQEYIVMLEELSNQLALLIKEWDTLIKKDECIVVSGGADSLKEILISAL